MTAVPSVSTRTSPVEPRMVETDVAIVGGGISGLASAYALEFPASGESSRGNAGFNTVLLEASKGFGGKIGTSRIHAENPVSENPVSEQPASEQLVSSYLLESGADSLVSQKPQGIDLCRQLGLGSELIAPPAIEPTMGVVHRGRLVALPRGLQMVVPTRMLPVLCSRLFSWRGKLDLLIERFRDAEPSGPGADPTLEQFIVRRFGQEAFDRLIEPIVGGLFTADASTLSLELTAPRLAELERRYGSVTGGMEHARRRAERGQRSRAPAPAQWGLRCGMSRMIDRLEESLRRRGSRTCLMPNTPATKITRLPSRGFHIETEPGPSIQARSVVVAAPGPKMATLLRDSFPAIAAAAAELEYASCATLHFAYDRSAVQARLPGFGFFVPRSEQSPLLACSFPSEKYPSRAPSDQILLRAFVGGARSPDLLQLDDHDLIEQTAIEVERWLRIRGERRFVHVERHADSMPQFVNGYSRVIADLNRRLEETPGLFVAGSVVGAYGIPDCIQSGRLAASLAMRFLEAAPSDARKLE